MARHAAAVDADDYARAIIAEGQRRGITERGIVIALATALVESNLKMYANQRDPESLRYPHEALSTDANSVGLFQQRAPWWGSTADRMDPARSAGMFYAELANLDYNSPARSPGWYAQQVQKSAYPHRYDQRVAEAQALYARLVGTTSEKKAGMDLQVDVTMLTAADSGWRDPNTCQAIVLHTNQGPEQGSLEGLLRFCQDTANGASYNLIVDAQGRIGRCNDDNYQPWAAGTTGNRIGLHVCALGYAEQSRAEWLDPPGLLDGLARVLAYWSQSYGIPLVKIGAAELRAGQRGVCGHVDISAAWHEVDHTDPGPNFPYDVVLDKARALLSTPAPPPPSSPPGDFMAALSDAEQRQLYDAVCRPRQSLVEGSTASFDPLTYALTADLHAFHARVAAEAALELVRKIAAQVGVQS